MVVLLYEHFILPVPFRLVLGCCPILRSAGQLSTSRRLLVKPIVRWRNHPMFRIPLLAIAHLLWWTNGYFEELNRGFGVIMQALKGKSLFKFQYFTRKIFPSKSPQCSQ